MSTVVIEGLLYSAKRVLSKPVNGNILRHAAACSEQALDDADSRQIVDGHDGGGAGAVLRDSQARRQSVFKAQVAAEDRSWLKPQIPHASFVAFQTNVVGFELGPAGHESNAPVAILIEILDDLLDCGGGDAHSLCYLSNGQTMVQGLCAPLFSAKNPKSKKLSTSREIQMKEIA